MIGRTHFGGAFLLLPAALALSSVAERTLTRTLGSAAKARRLVLSLFFRVPRGFPSQPCTSDNQCYTNSCYDGVCCNEGCNGTCQTCAAAGTVGECELVPAGANNPNHPCPNGGVCNGVGPTSAACVQCVTDADCPAPAVCTSNVCLLSSGQPCSTGAQCASGVCTSPGNTCM